MRVLIVARWYPGHDDPGRGSFVADLVAALRDEGSDVRVASWEYAHYGSRTPETALARAREAWSRAVAGSGAMNVPKAWGARVPVARLPALYVAGETVRQRIAGHAALLVPFGAALHERWPFEIIHAHTAVPDGAAALELGRRVGVPVMVTEHDRSLRQRLRDSEDERAAYRAVLDGAAVVVAVSAPFRDLLTRELGLDRGAIDVIPNSIPAAFFAQSLDRQRDRNELLYVGSRKEDKGIVTLLEAFARVHAARPALRLRLVGRSPSDADEARWQSLSDELGVARNTRFDPPADRGAVAGLMARASVFVHPSPFESFGMVAAEALACGLPIAATRSGVEEIVGEDGRFGEIAEGVDAASLSDAILGVVNRRNTYDAETLRDRASRFEPSAVAREHLARYGELIAKVAAGASERQDAIVWRAEQIAVATAPSDSPLRMERVLAVGQNAVLAERRVRSLPEGLCERIVLATHDPSDSLRGLLPGRIVELDPGSAYKRLLEGLGAPPGGVATTVGRLVGLVRSPAKAVQRRRVRKDRERVLAELLKAQVGDAWEALSDDPEGSPILLATDVEDVTAAGRVLARGVPLAPGGTRWLADRWDAAQGTIGRGPDA